MVDHKVEKKEIDHSEPCVPVNPAEPKPIRVFARRMLRVKSRLRADAADSAAMNILGENRESNGFGERGQGSSGSGLLELSVSSGEALPISEIGGPE